MKAPQVKAINGLCVAADAIARVHPNGIACECGACIENREKLLDARDAYRAAGSPVVPEYVAQGEQCPHAYYDEEDGPDADNRCRSPREPGATVCVNAHQGYTEDGCRKPLVDVPSARDIDTVVATLEDKASRAGTTYARQMRAVAAFLRAVKP